MPKSPTGEMHVTAVSGNAVEVLGIAAGEEEGMIPAATAAAALGKLGGAARARNMTPERRAEIARKAAAKRWEKG